jgi:hypothetical protein
MAITWPLPRPLIRRWRADRAKALARTETRMTHNQRTVVTYRKAFARPDHAGILACLADKVRWVMAGAHILSPKETFDKAIENPAFVSRPIVRMSRILEENDVPCFSSRKDGPDTPGLSMNRSTS